MAGLNRNFAQRQRQNYIFHILGTVGYINRVDLQKRFGISAPQASHDLRVYKQLHADGIIYNPKKRRYENPLPIETCFELSEIAQIIQDWGLDNGYMLVTSECEDLAAKIKEPTDDTTRQHPRWNMGNGEGEVMKACDAHIVMIKTGCEVSTIGSFSDRDALTFIKCLLAERPELKSHVKIRKPTDDR